MSIYLFILIKHCTDIITQKSFIIWQFYEHIYAYTSLWISGCNIYIKHLSEITPEVGVTTERGAHFHPTVGSATPKGFTTSHPWAKTTMLWDCVSIFQWPGAKVTLLTLCYHSLCISPEFSFSPHIRPPHCFYPTPYPLARLRVAQLPSCWSGLTALWMGGSPPIPH